MKQFIIFLKILMFFLAAIFGLYFNVLGGIAYITNANAPQIGISLLVTTTVCYIGGTVLVMLNKTIAAGILSIISIFSLLAIKSQVSGLSLEYNSTELFMRNHMPSVFLSVVIILIAILSNTDTLRQYREEKERRDNAPTTSIINGKTISGKAEGNKKHRR